MRRGLFALSLAALLIVSNNATVHSFSTSASRTAPKALALSAHRAWVQKIQPNADSAAAYLANVSIRGKRHNIVYVLAGNNTSNCSPDDPVQKATTYALGDSNGKILWSRSTSGPSRCTTAGPVVDPNGKWIYSPGLDGKIHRYNAGTGAESRTGGWPETITLIPSDEKVAATPTISTGHLYVTTSGFIGDQGHYEGHLVTIDLRSGTSHVFNSLCSNMHRFLARSSCSFVQSGLFGRGEGVTDPVNHDVYVVSGNGPWNGRTNWGDSILKLDPSGSRLIDSFTPTNQQQLSDSDEDLGSTGPALLPAVKQGGRSYHLLVQGGKGPACNGCSGVPLRLLNRDDLSGRRGIGHLGGDLQDVQTPGSCEVLTAPLVWKTVGQIWVFYANSCGTAGYRLFSTGGGKFRLRRMWFSSHSGSTPVLKHGVLYVAQSGHVYAYKPTNGATLARIGIGNIHWEYPLVAGRRLFITDEQGHVSAFLL